MRHISYLVPAIVALVLPFACKSETTCDEVGGDPNETYPNCTPAGASGSGGAGGSAGAAGKGGNAGKGGSTGQAGTAGDGAGTSASGGSGAAGGAAGAGAGGSSNGGSGEGGAGDGGSTAAGGTGGSDAGEAGEAGAAGGGGDTCDGSLSPSDESCLVSEDFAIFVAPDGSDSAIGSKQAPVKTLAHALALAHDAEKFVIACSSAGAFEEAVTIDADLDGARVYGGFDCGDWEYSADNKTEVVSPSTVALRVDALAEGLTIEDFAFTAADATTAGGSSMGAFVTDSENVTLRRVDLTAGKGAKGEDGTGVATAAETGATGNNGVAACEATAQPNGGAAEVETVCGGVPSGSIGAKGGDGGSNNSNAGNGDNGLPDFGAGGPGTGEGVVTNWNCNQELGKGGAFAGATGSNGAPGKGGAGKGALSEDGYEGVSGEAGESGLPGQGGGGGGGAKAPLTCGNPRTGASGGSGAGGGCGGKGGSGGRSGGASIALATVNSTILLEQGSLLATEAGSGGAGGMAQGGGLGGSAGKGANGVTGLSSASCGGGNGGRGGDGGFGGGGAGGASIGIAFVGAAPTQTNVDIDVADVAALGGADGASMTNGPGAGEPGATEEVMTF